MIDPQKYKDIFYGNTHGKLLMQQVVENWPTWVENLSLSRVASQWCDVAKVGNTPWGTPHNGSYIDDAAATIFTATVWGYGCEDWEHKTPKARAEALNRLNRLTKCREYTDPLELVILDEWLQSIDTVS